MSGTPNWNYIRIDVALPDHEKTDGLSDKAFRTLIELWCWCGYHLNDGFVREAKWKTFGSKTARAQLVDHGWAEQVNGGYMMHDFVGPDGHQGHVQRWKRSARNGRKQAKGAPPRVPRREPRRYDSLNKTATSR